MTDERQRDDNERDITHLVDIEQARERPERLQRLAEAPDTGPTTDEDTDAPIHEDNDLPGDKRDIYERGTTILPPG
jgi:hypothetical protein